ncbi:MAG TPA: AAA family ATPase [Candidatus Limnocylindrales bacterium]|nr:AAA family ATPase [Candidatus Limnocylindrales bacterium]
MSNIAALTGQARAVRELLGWVTSSRTFVQPTALLSGPSGSGKTWVAEQLADLAPDTVACVFTSGDKSNTARPYTPFSAATMSVRRASFAADAIPEIARAADPRFGSLTQFLLKYMLTRTESEKVRRSFLLDDTEREILLRLERLAGGNRLLLVLDDLQWWDDKSIGLVKLMLSPQWNEAFPFLADTVYLALTTPGQESASAAYEGLLERFTSFETTLTYCERNDFNAILIGLGLRKALPPNVARDLYEISRGHLAVARLLVEDLNHSVDIEELLAERDFERFTERVIVGRLRSAAGDAPALREVLSYAAIIGRSFSQKELECLAHEFARQFLKCVRAAKELRLFVERGPMLTFVHELYPRVLKLRDPDESRELNRRFTQCLLRIRPGDYAARARHLHDAGDFIAAHVTEIHGVLADVRDGRLGRLTHEYPDESRHESLNRFHAEISAMYRAYHEARYSDVIRMAEFIDPTLPASLRAETDYLVALCRTKSLSHAERKRAASLLEQWWHMLDVEPELWARLALARIITLGQMGERDGMDAVARELIEQLEQHVDYDFGAQRIYARLALRADLLYRPDVAERRLAEVVRYFGPSASGIMARDPLGYYLALTNFTGNQIALSKYESARDSAERCEAYVQSVEGTIDAIQFPRLDVLANNSVLSAYRSVHMSAATAADSLRTVIQAAPRSNDLPLLVSNRVGFDVLSGVAVDVSALEAEFGHLINGDFEAYYTFFTGNNLAAAYLMSSDVVAARRVWSQIAPLVGQLDERVREYMTWRQLRLDGALRIADCTLEQCEAAIRADVADAVGPSWDHYSHVVLLSELQIWSDG